MFDRLDGDVDPWKAAVVWLTAVFAPVAVVAVGALLRPELVYDEFVWRYFVGPIDAASQGVREVPREGVTSADGYTAVSLPVYIYYMLLGVVAAVGVLEYFDAGDSMAFFYAMVPFAFLGGAARVLQDAGAVEPPVAYLFVSPVIYFSMFFFTVAILALGLELRDRGVVEDYERPVAAGGLLAFAAVAAYLAFYGATEAEFVFWVPVAVAVAATLTAAVVYFAVDKAAPVVNEATGFAGAVVLWGHLVDGFSTVVGVEHLGYGEKQPVSRMVIEVFGTAYAFVAVKIAIVLLILWAFDTRFFDDYRRTPYILLVAVLAVGLGPGTRNTLRMMLGI